MSWQDEAVIMLRVLIGDIGDEPIHCDSSLQKLLVVAAHYVNQEIEFNYTVSISDMSITPDPTDPRDDAFLNFIVLKAACLTDQGTFRAKAVLEGLSSRLGPASLTISGNLRGFKDILEKGPCKSYEDLKLEYKFGNPHIKAIFSPFVGPFFDPRDLNNTDRREC